MIIPSQWYSNFFQKFFISRQIINHHFRIEQKHILIPVYQILTLPFKSKQKRFLFQR